MTAQTTELQPAALVQLPDAGLPSWEEFQAVLVEGLAERLPGVELAEDLLAIDLAAADDSTKVEVLKAWARSQPPRRGMTGRGTRSARRCRWRRAPRTIGWWRPGS